MRNPLTKPQLVIRHLKIDGRITDAVARATYGSFRLADAIYRLRNDRADLVPKGMQIVTIDREDVEGNQFAEYRLVPKTPQFMAAPAQETQAHA
ncbi:hypothetical protein [Caulobacter sp.]|uniref:hypothetical protein n=1 Tax=Caulobacter sp. TaxID=78 RepID=UPI0031D7D6CC